MSDVDYLEKAKAMGSGPTQRRYLRLHEQQLLRSDIDTCRACPRGDARIKPSVAWSGSLKSSIAFVTSHPNKHDEAAGEAITAASPQGDFLEQTLNKLGIDHDEVLRLNLVSCGGGLPLTDEIKACRPYFNAQLEISAAWIVVLFGESALWSIRPEASFEKVRGVPFWKNGRVWIATHSLNRAGSKKGLKRDIGAAVDLSRGLGGGLAMGVEQWEKANGGEFNRLSVELLNERGWVSVRLRRIDEVVVLLAEDDVEVPDEMKGIPTYTCEELTILGENFPGAKLTKGEVSKVHLMKKMFDGKVVA